MKQLELSVKHLLKIGFVKKIYPKDDLNRQNIIYEIPFINGYFSYNPKEFEYRWYHVTKTGSGFNHIHLNIERLPELFLVLSCFRVKYNLAIKEKD